MFAPVMTLSASKTKPESGLILLTDRDRDSGAVGEWGPRPVR